MAPAMARARDGDTIGQARLWPWPQKGGLRLWHGREDMNEDAAGDDGVVRRSARVQSAAGEPVLTERTQGLNIVHVYVSDNGSIYGRSVENGMDR